MKFIEYVPEINTYGTITFIGKELDFEATVSKLSKNRDYCIDLYKRLINKNPEDCKFIQAWIRTPNTSALDSKGQFIRTKYEEFYMKTDLKYIPVECIPADKDDISIEIPFKVIHNKKGCIKEEFKLIKYRLEIISLDELYDRISRGVL